MENVLFKENEFKYEVVEECKICTTTNYEIFNFIECNRAINVNAVDRIKKSLKSNGFVSGSLIVVDEDFNVFDGQHRIEAAKKLFEETGSKVSLMFAIIPGLHVDIIQTLNSVANTWKMHDVLKHYADLGYEDFVLMHNLFTKEKIQYPKLTCGIFLKILFQGKDYEETLRKGISHLTEELVEEYHGLMENYVNIFIKHRERFKLRSATDNIYNIMPVIQDDTLCCMLNTFFNVNKEYIFDISTPKSLQKKSTKQYISDIVFGNLWERNSTYLK